MGKAPCKRTKHIAKASLNMGGCCTDVGRGFSNDRNMLGCVARHIYHGNLGLIFTQKPVQHHVKQRLLSIQCASASLTILRVNATCFLHASLMSRGQKKCQLADVWLKSNFTQHVPTTSNIAQHAVQTIATCYIQRCWQCWVTLCQHIAFFCTSWCL